jgi:hypothetical protein
MADFSRVMDLLTTLAAKVDELNAKMNAPPPPPPADEDQPKVDAMADGIAAIIAKIP